MGCMGYILSNTLCPEPHENAHCRIKTSSIATDDSGLSLVVRPRDGHTWQAEARTTCGGMCTGTELCSKLASTLTASAELVKISGIILRLGMNKSEMKTKIGRSKNSVSFLSVEC